jgi:hypothetical protein
MARRIANIPTTAAMAAYADGAALVNGTYLHALKGSNTTQQVYVWEISINGQAASSSSPMFIILSYDSTVGVGAQSYGTGSDNFLNPNFTTLGTATGSGNVFVTSAPVRSLGGHLLNCSLNAFGGVYFWRANRLEECPMLYGNTAATNGEVSLSAFTGGTMGAVGSHLIYEAL